MIELSFLIIGYERFGSL